MRENKVKRKLAAGEASFGTWVTLGHLHASRVLARAGFDWLCLDVEHAPYDWRETAAVVAAIADSGCVPLIRVPIGSHDWIKRALDAGAFGIVVPMVDTPEQAKQIIAAAKYPPQGTRSSGGGMHNLNFDCPVGEYYQRANNETLVILQTESPEGVRNAKAIYSLPGCDAIFVGPNDLKFQMRSPDGEFPSDERIEAEIQQVIATGKATGCPTGMHVLSAEHAKMRVSQGMQFVAVASDLGLLAASVERLTGELGCPGASDLARY